MRISYLGELDVTRGGTSVQLSGRRLRSLLVRLASDPGRAVATAALTEAVWGDEGTPSDPANALQSLVSRLRRALGDAGLVEQVPTGYRLLVARDAVDAARFVDLAGEGHAALGAGDLERAGRALDAALGLWRGGPTDDDRSPDGEADRVQLHELHVQVLLDRAETDLATGNPEPALARVEQAAAALPLREDIAAVHLRALVAVGRPAEALAAYERTRTYLRETLGSDPSPALRALHLEILAAGDAPLPTRGVSTNVGAGVTSFLGREDDVVAVRRRLTEYRLVTVVGAGGAGKTRLASEVARSIADHDGAAVRDGVWFVELAPVTEPGSVALAVIDALGLQDLAVLESRIERSRTAGPERVLEALSGLSCLVVLDNCEHLVDAVAGLAADVLARCPGVRLLATSREPLAIDGEALHPLSPLPVPTEDATVEELRGNVAVRLLLDRATAAGSTLRLDPTTREPVRDVVRRLDGMPLAIELAAARLRAMSIGEVAARLDDRFRLLTGGRRTALPRHRTLRAVVEWSWQLLAEDEREVAEHFCLFSGGADAAAVAAVAPRLSTTGRRDPAAAQAEAVDLLQALVDKSLLVARPGPRGTRYRMLETLREYGADRLAEQGLTEVAGLAHARHYASLVRDADRMLRTPQQLEGLAVLDAERENVLAALTFLGEHGLVEEAVRITVDLGWYWTLRDNDQDSVRWTAFALGLPGAADAELAPLAEAWHLISGMDGPALGPTAPEADEVLRRMEPVLDRSPGARLLACLVRYFGGDHEGGLEQLRQVTAGDPDPWIRAAARTVITTVLENEGDVAAMRQEVDRVLAEWDDLGDAWGTSIARSMRGQLRVLEGDLDGARQDFQLARDSLAGIGNSGDELLALTRLGDIAVRRGDLEDARRHAARAAQWRPPAGREHLRDILVGVLHSAVALAVGELDEVREADARLRAATTRATGRGRLENHPLAVGCAALCLLRLALDDVPQARTDVQQGYTLALSTQDQPIIAGVAVAVAALAERIAGPTQVAALLGAAARLRGADDPTQPVVARLSAAARDRLGDAAFEEAFASGKELTREEATRLADPARLGSAE